MVTISSGFVREGKILIVDDEVKILKLLSRSLLRDGHDVKVTTDPTRALRLISQEPFDVLILDNRMPQLTGLEVLGKTQRAAAPPEVIMMTAFATVDTAVEAMKGGAVDYIQKPFDFDSMKEAVRRALG
ncbi:MAG: response regulator, partial [Acidobacteriota bacterium]